MSEIFSNGTKKKHPRINQLMRLIYLYHDIKSYCRYNYVACSHEISCTYLTCKGQKLIKLYVNDAFNSLCYDFLKCLQRGIGFYF